TVYFGNTFCARCDRFLGFSPERLNVLSLQSNADGTLQHDSGARFRYCLNHQQYKNCNWLVDADAADSLCLSCGLNEVIPSLTTADNLQLWTRIERAKRRLVYSLLSLGLKLQHTDGSAIRFRLLEDRQRNPNVLESFVTIGHHQGTITLNIAEADDATRHTIREQMSETYRTVLGHLRHESGHFYFGPLTAKPAMLEECRRVFGDEREDYASSLERYYQSGPANNWPQNFISAYASAHPAEDFAESFAHVLHITDALETARNGGLVENDESRDWLEDWAELAVTLNEINRALGLDDIYPFQLSTGVRSKLNTVRELISHHAQHQPGAVQAG
ncbi:MAG TPA: putative zinc-binding metallopeptidase, partial [Xanthomonadales bacterium]|nr:putative zinc-binding metallopeptidase [Xanthomonadales bacterium]